MRFHLPVLLLIAAVAVPAVAQPREPVERRIERLEQELRAVQRRVFPDGRAPVMPEIRPQLPTGPAGLPTGDALANLTARLDAVESQLRSLTGQVEEQGHRTRQLEQQVVRLEAELSGRLDRLEAAAAPAPEAGASANEEEMPAEEPVPAEPGAPDDAAAQGPDAAEAAYNEAFRMWDSGRFREAQEALGEAAERYPDSRWTSWMRNLEGRAYLDDGKPATAARIFLANYQDRPRGERAADSLFFLGEALTRLDRMAEACRVYEELDQVYPQMRGFLRERLPDARRAARCD